jgi:hypothetical protein
MAWRHEVTRPQYTVMYERKFSDGNYGSEGLSLAWTGTYEDDDPLVIGAKYTQVAAALRAHVLEQLARSAAERVRWAANRELRGDESKPTPDVDIREPVTVGEVEDLPF